jgi:hypothetical protein
MAIAFPRLEAKAGDFLADRVESEAFRSSAQDDERVDVDDDCQIGQAVVRGKEQRFPG